MKLVEGYSREELMGRGYQYVPGRADADETAAGRDQLLRMALRDRELANHRLEEANAKLQQALSAQQLLVNEIDHRVRNTLQMVSSLIVMQSRTTADPAVRTSLAAILERVQALSAVQRRLYQSTDQSTDLTRFDVAAFMRELGNELHAAAAQSNVQFDMELDPVELSMEYAAPLALIVNELLSNSLKHAFSRESAGHIAVSLKKEKERFCLSVADNGVSLDDAEAGDSGARETASFSRTLVESLSRQLRGTAHWSSSSAGDRVDISVPLMSRGAK